MVTKSSGTKGRPRGRPFPKGTSGNPGGRPARPLSGGKGAADLQVSPRRESRFADDKDDVVVIGTQAAEGQDLKRLLIGFHQLLLEAVAVAARLPVFGRQDQSVLSAERPNALARHHLVVGDPVGVVAWLAGAAR